VFAKGRLAPIKEVTIPKLELTAAVLGKRISSFISRQSRLDIAEVFVWTDSMCTLHWINSPKVLSVYVENRVKEIRAEKSYQLRYVPTEDNPADLLSRGCSATTLKESSLWWNGPEFLQKPESEWPSMENVNILNSDDTAEEKTTPVVTLSNTSRKTNEESAYPFSIYSSLPKLLRITCWVRRFITFSKDRIARKTNASSTLRVFEMHNAQMFWVKKVQQEVYPNLNAPELKDLKHNLQLFLDAKGVIRSKGRLENSDLETPTKFPILLPKKHWFTEFMMLDCHERLMHAKVRQTLAQVRLVYWVPQGRQLLESLLFHCRKCRSTEGGAFRTPISPPLPPFRVRQSPPFSFVGIDYLGPAIVRILPTITWVGKKNPKKLVITERKAWICLFTCAVVRAVHLELVDDQTAEDFLLALRRFVATYGRPQMIICDNAGNFQTTGLLFAELSRQQKIQEYSTNEGISWYFIPEAAPWMGAFYERMVQTVKRALRKTLGKNCLTVVQLQTLLAEVSAVVNTRPLVQVEHEAGEEALTPAHFLSKQGREGLPSFTADVVGNFRDETTGRGALIRRWNESQKAQEEFWQTWRHEYLASLRERPAVKFNDRKAVNMFPRPGMVVLIKDEKLPRGRWKLGRIKDINTSHDGNIRSVSLKLANKKIIVRPIRHLYPLEDVEVPRTHVKGALEDLNSGSHNGSEADFEGFSDEEIEETSARLQRFPIPDISSDVEDDA
jgi:hypothetical protein